MATGRPRTYTVTLTDPQRQQLQQMLASGRWLARDLDRARILLLVDAGHTNSAVAQQLDTSRVRVNRVCKRFFEEGLEAAVHDRPRPGAAPKLDSEQEACLTALACSTGPEGRSRWTLRLLADKLVELGVVDTISHETVRQTLKKTL
jgi:transposase